MQWYKTKNNIIVIKKMFLSIIVKLIIVIYLFLISKPLLKDIKIHLILNYVRQDLFCEFVPLTLTYLIFVLPFTHQLFKTPPRASNITTKTNKHLKKYSYPQLHISQIQRRVIFLGFLRKIVNFPHLHSASLAFVVY